jgi:tetratricopeptide (TPR) repeat protein
MSALHRLGLCVLFATCGSFVAAQLPLGEVAKVARARAERSRPAQQKALEPFWSDLSLDYRNNTQFLDGRIGEIAALGDSVVPMLLEKLAPSQGGEQARNLAANCRRVLEKLDPAGFLDALAELANGANDTGRHEAIRLLGFAATAQSVNLLADLLDRTAGEDKRLVVGALKRLRAAEAAAKVAPMLASSDRQIREDVLGYLVAARPAQVADLVVAALTAERETKLLPHYVDYFLASVRNHDAAARALLPLLDRDLDYQDKKRLLVALGTVAPHEHDATVRRLQEWIDTGDSSSLGVQAALTLRTLGDKNGITKMKRNLDQLLAKAQRKREAALYEQRGNLMLGIEEYADALADFEKMREFSDRDGMAMTRRAYVGLMKCESRRKKLVPNLTKLMKESGFTVAEIEAIGADDPQFAESLQHEKVKAFLQALAKEQQPK